MIYLIIVSVIIISLLVSANILLLIINRKENEIMTSLETLQAFVTELDAESTRIAELLAGLLEQVNSGTITNEQLTTELQPIVDGLRALGTNPPTA